MKQEEEERGYVEICFGWFKLPPVQAQIMYVSPRPSGPGCLFFEVLNQERDRVGVGPCFGEACGQRPSPWVLLA